MIYSETQITPEYAYMFDFDFEVNGFSDDLNLKESGFIDVSWFVVREFHKNVM